MNDRYLFKAKDCNSIWRAGLLIALQEGRCAIEEKDGSMTTFSERHCHK